MTRFVAFHASPDPDPEASDWHILDTEQPRVGLYYDNQHYAEQAATRLNSRESAPAGWTWTPLDSLDANVRQAAEQHLPPTASPEFWAEAQLAAEAAGYCEVFDRIAHLLGGPVRSGRDEATRSYVTLTVRVHVPDGTAIDALTGAVTQGLSEIEGLRFSAHTQATVTESPDVMALRERMAELRAARAAEQAASTDGLADWEQALIETAE